MTDSERLALLEGCLDPESALWLQSMKDTDVGTTYQEFFALLGDKHILHKDKGIRDRWYNLSLSDEGKILPREWDGFETRFKMAQKDVPGATEDEAYRLLNSKLLTVMTMWVAEKESKLNRTKPVVIFRMGPGYTERQISNVVRQLTGDTPIEVKAAENDNFQVKFDSESKAKRLVAFDGRTLEGGRQRLFFPG